MSGPAPIDGDRLAGEIEQLARISDSDYPSVTRVLFTETDMRARAWLMERMGERRTRRAGGRRRQRLRPLGGGDPDAPPVATGSHIDAIPDAGRFDGVIGVLGGSRPSARCARPGCARAGRSSSSASRPRSATRFGLGCLGSRILAGVVNGERLARLRDGDGMTLDEAREAAGVAGDLGGRPAAAGRVRGLPGAAHGGKLLEAAAVPIGVVTAIAAPATLRVELWGEGGHAGAVLMADRHDPLVAAAEVVGAVNGEARGSGFEGTVGTVGLMTIEPGAVNSIPRRVMMDIDLRDVEAARRDAVLERVRAAAREAAAARGVGHRDEVLNADGPAASDPALIAAIEEAAAEAGHASIRMVSSGCPTTASSWRGSAPRR